MLNKNKGKHIITSAVEHHAVLHTVKALEKDGFKVTYLPVDEYGMVSAEDVKNAITDETILITIMFANNEIGTIMPIEEIGKIAKEKGIIFHTDAVQAVGMEEIDVEKMNIDLLSLTAHKFYGPKGIGALYIRKGVKIRRFIEGGAQERNKRAGTENVAGIVGLGKAIELATTDIAGKKEKLSKLRDFYIKEVMEDLGKITGESVSDEIINWDTEIYSDPIETQNEFFRCATGIENLYEREYNYEFSYNNVYSLDNDSKIIGNFSVMRINEGVDASLTASITASKGGHIYIYISSRQLDDVDVSSEVIETSMDVSDGYIMDLGYYNEGEIVSVKMPIKDDYESANVFFTVFTMSDEKFIDGYNKLKSGQLELSEFEDTSIKGSFTVEENEILFTSIPYDKGWSVIIDGIPASDESIIKISDTLLGIKVDAGEHDIELKYSIPGMDIACLISAWFILLLIIITILKKNKMLIFKNMKDNIWIESEKNFCSPPKANEDNN